MLAPEPPLDDWLAEIDALASRSAGFFSGRAVLLDVAAMGLDRDGLAALLTALGERQIRIMAIEGFSQGDLGLGMPPVVSGGRETAVETDERKPSAQPAPRIATLVLDHPIRSGQTISYPDGDVVVVGAIGSGAEVVAGGSIHVYGTLRGRAIAGSIGNAHARIFCRKFEAELLAIDGLYVTADGMDPDLRGRPAQVWLDGETVMMAALDLPA